MDAEIKEMCLHVINSSLDLKDKRKLLNDIRKLRAPEDNRWNFWYVIFALALTALSVPCYAIWQLAIHAKPEVPEALLSIAATSIGALAGFLMRQERNAVRRDTHDPK